MRSASSRTVCSQAPEFLQSHELQRLGGNETVRLDVDSCSDEQGLRALIRTEDFRSPVLPSNSSRFCAAGVTTGDIACSSALPDLTRDVDGSSVLTAMPCVLPATARQHSRTPRTSSSALALGVRPRHSCRRPARENPRDHARASRFRTADTRAPVDITTPTSTHGIAKVLADQDDGSSERRPKADGKSPKPLPDWHAPRHPPRILRTKTSKRRATV